jgi:SAM-dependent methyltransferase
VSAQDVTRIQAQDHWERVYTTKPSDGVSWFQAHAEQSLRLIRASGLPSSAQIMDVGGGASTLVDDLLAHGYSALTVLDLSAAALEQVRARLGAQGRRVRWLVGDITQAELPQHAYDLWHDRAVFHFLTEAEQRRAYVAQVLHALRPGGHVVVATFAEDGPAQCSGLPVARYSPDALQAEFGAPFELLEQRREAHRTPTGAVQQFIYCHCRRRA